MTHLLLLACLAAAQQQPRAVDPGDTGRPPSDAVVLFNGKDMAGWTTQDGQPARCEVADAVMNCRTGVGNIFTQERFTGAQIHIEFNVPYQPDQEGQLRGNSGVYVHCYEVQILDSFENPTYPDGSCGAIYGIAAPLVNASRRPGEWQSYDIVFHPPRCNPDASIAEPGSMTVFHNGVLIQDQVRLARQGSGCDPRAACQPGQLMLQDHSGFPGAPDTTMQFRNIWLRRLDGEAAAQRKRERK